MELPSPARALLAFQCHILLSVGPLRSSGSGSLNDDACGLDIHGSRTARRLDVGIARRRFARPPVRPVRWMDPTLHPRLRVKDVDFARDTSRSEEGRAVAIAPRGYPERGCLPKEPAS